MSDLDAIRELLARYCHYVDAADWDGVGALFEHGRLADEAGNEIAAGAAAVADFFRSGTRLYDGSPRTTHVVANTYLEEPLVARSTFVVLQAADAGGIDPIVTGTYRDSFERRDGALIWHERRFAVILRGDLTRHLTYEV